MAFEPLANKEGDVVTMSTAMRAPYPHPPGDDQAPKSKLGDLSASTGLPQPHEAYLDAADGARIRYASWRTPLEDRQGVVLYLNGRTEFIEKTMEIYAILCRSGFDVWTLDWRGQGLSTRALADRHKGHVTDYQHFLDDLNLLVSETAGLSDMPGKVIMLGHSMGGHIGLRYLHDHPGLFDAAAFSAPMIDISVNRWPLRALNTAIDRVGLSKAYAPGTGRFQPVFVNPDDPSDNGELADYQERIERFRALSSDAAKWRRIEGRIRSNPALALGGPTAGWLKATFRSINLTWQQGYAEAIETPVLMLGGGQDKVVVTARQEEMAKRLPNGRFEVIDQAAHELLVECDDIRFAFLEKFAAFAGITIDQPAIDMIGCCRD